MASTRQLRSSKRRTTTQSWPISSKDQPSNTKGLPCLADELYLEILSHFPPFPLPINHKTRDIQPYGDRRLVLDALSQTCRALRRVSLRYRWQRIEVYSEMDLGKGPLPKVRHNSRGVSTCSKAYAEELVRQLEVVTVREPALAEFVDVLDIYVTDYSAKTIVPELARCMSLMPNLHTIQIYLEWKGIFGFDYAQLIPCGFHRYVYPQIRTACVSMNAFPILSRAPNVKALHVLKPNLRYTSGLLEYIKSITPSINILGAIPVSAGAGEKPFSYYVDKILLFRDLQDVKFKLGIIPSDADMEALSKMPSLRVLRLLIHLNHAFNQRLVEDWESRMKTTLFKASDSSDESSKQLIVTIA
ncbi:hypothetical protein BDN70DRAFT_919157 [Pholiota conissans]|uniref:Uncharacterized protein n=1 Tax=Pholiota conissans TaxID=109636 RepID=A0A9P5Z7E7_9AGAR|nr:hypothetical protein BDN70DRAFT_919157 [Pholiota conissans]